MKPLPVLLVAAPMRGPSGARLAPLLKAIAEICPTRFIVATASDADLAPGPALSFAAWLDDPALDHVPHLHILADDGAAAHALRAALHRPGVTVLEDGGLAGLHRAMTRDAGQVEPWLRLLARHHGPAARRLGRAALAGLATPAQWARMPMLDAVAEVAPLLVTRSRHALDFLPPGSRAVALPAGFPAPVSRPGPGRRGLALALAHPLSARALAPIAEAAALAGAHCLPWLPGDDLALEAADAVLALALPFGATPLQALHQALARGLPVLTWEADPAAEIAPPAVTTIAWPAAPSVLAQAIAALLDEAAPRAVAALQQAASHTPRDAAAALLQLVPGCRVG